MDWRPPHVRLSDVIKLSLLVVFDHLLTSLVYDIVHDYVAGLADADRLLDMINDSREGQEARAPQGALLYPEVWYASQAVDQELTSVVLHAIKNVNRSQSWDSSPGFVQRITVQLSGRVCPCLGI